MQGESVLQTGPLRPGAGALGVEPPSRRAACGADLGFSLPGSLASSSTKHAGEAPSEPGKTSARQRWTREAGGRGTLGKRSLDEDPGIQPELSDGLSLVIYWEMGHCQPL